MILDSLCSRTEALLARLSPHLHTGRGESHQHFDGGARKEAESLPKAEEESCAVAGSQLTGMGMVPCVSGVCDSLQSDSIKCLLSNSSGECSARLLAEKQASPL